MLSDLPAGFLASLFGESMGDQAATPQLDAAVTSLGTGVEALQNTAAAFTAAIARFPNQARTLTPFVVSDKTILPASFGLSHLIKLDNQVKVFAKANMCEYLFRKVDGDFPDANPGDESVVAHLSAQLLTCCAEVPIVSDLEK